MSRPDIETALWERLAAFSHSPAIPVSFPNVAGFVKPAQAFGSQWLRATLLPVPIAPIAIGSDSFEQIDGILQVDAVMYPGGGEPPVSRLAQLVIDWFARGTTLTKNGETVRVIRPPYRGPLQNDDPWVFIPVTVPYQAFSS